MARVAFGNTRIRHLSAKDTKITKEKKHLTADGRRQTQTTRTSPGSKKTSCWRMRISKLIIIRQQLYSEPDVSGSTAPRLASRCSLYDLIVDIRRRVQRFVSCSARGGSVVRYRKSAHALLTFRKNRRSRRNYYTRITDNAKYRTEGKFRISNCEIGKTRVSVF
jgi:hypothetical protein